MLPSRSEDVTYEITSIANHIFMDRVIRHIIKNAVRGRAYLPTIDNNGDLDGNSIYIEFVNDIDRTDGKNMIRSLRYTAHDLFDEEAIELESSICSMDTVNYGVSVVEEVVLGDLDEQGSWDVTTNDPTLSDATGTKNHYYVVNNEGTINLGSGDIAWVNSDIIFHDGIKWGKLNI